ncbi:MAG: vitamin K epoxide reductase family protein [Gemmatimonadales bacterium]
MRQRQAIALLALIGFFIALYLWLHQVGVAGELRCGTGGCDTVQASRWARQLGIPVAFYGVVGYAAILAVALAGLRPAALASPAPARWLLLLSTAGVLFSAWLTYLELFVIHAICRWCVGSAVVMAGIWGVAMVGTKAHKGA